MSNEIFSLVGRVALDGQQAVERGLDDLDDASAEAGRGLVKLEDRFEQVGETVSNVGGTMSKWVTGPLAAVGAGIGAVASKGAETARELQRQSTVTGESVEELQKLQFASESVGIEGDKMADIIKDAGDKFGDFSQNQAGPLADFFENIAPQVGVTAEQFKNLSGKESLQLYVDSLEKANVSQSEMTFYMEALASDSTALLPLLRNNGEELKKMGDQAERSGLILSEQVINSVNESQGSMATFGKAMNVVTVVMADALIPVLESLIPILTQQVVPALKSAADFIKGVTDSFRALPQPVQDTIIKAVAFAAAIGPILLLGGKLIGVFGSLIAIAKTVGVVILGLTSTAFAPVILAVGGAVAAFFVLKAAFETIQAVVDRFGPTVKRIIGDMFDSVVGFFKRLPGMAIGFITKMVSGVVNKVKNMARNVIDSIKGMFNSVVGNSIIPDMADQSIKVAGEMNAGVTDQADRMARNVVSAADGMPDSISPAAGRMGPGGANDGSRGGVTVDMRNAVIRDDRDMLDRLRASGVDLNGALG